MRIVAGIHGGRRLKSPSGLRVRPTPDKVREALYSILGDRTFDATVLDLFAGTGAIGLEALSRGARFVHFVEQSSQVRRVIKENVDDLKLGPKVEILAGKIPQCLDRIARSVPPFDLIFADPPYGKGYPEALLSDPSLEHLLDPGGMLILELPKGEEPESGRWQRLDVRHYGDTLLSFYKLITR